MKANAPYDDPANLFRVYSNDECDKKGYPFVWNKISEHVRRDANYECSMCGKAYLLPEFKSVLTVHHFNGEKADCRRRNLESMCWTCHLQDHSPPNGLKERYCRQCKAWFKSWAYLYRHIQGKHRNKTPKRL